MPLASRPTPFIARPSSVQKGAPPHGHSLERVGSAVVVHPEVDALIVEEVALPILPEFNVSTYRDSREESD